MHKDPILIPRTITGSVDLLQPWNQLTSHSPTPLRVVFYRVNPVKLWEAYHVPIEAE